MHFPRPSSDARARHPRARAEQDVARAAHPARRRVGRVALAVLVSASLWSCGDSGEPTGPGAGPQLEKLAGDDLAAAPLAAMATPPTVRVVDGGGRPVAGAVVRFQAMAGGGSVGRAVDTTDASGTADAGSWTLGGAIGAQQVEARLDGSTLSALFTARVLPADVVAPAVSVGPEGGELRPDLAGSGIDSLTITVPAGAYAGTTTFQVATAPVPALPDVPDFRPLARLHVDAGGAVTDSLVRLRIPLRVGAGQVLAAYWYDSTTRTLDPIPVLDTDSASITIATGSFRWSGVGGGATGGAAASRTGARRGLLYDAYARIADVVLTVVEERTLLGGNAVTGFAPGQDDWDFTNLGSAITTGGNCHGQSLSAIWYYDQRKAAGRPSLSTLYAPAPRIAALLGGDNRAPYRHASLVQRDANLSARTQLLIAGSLYLPGDRANFLLLADALRKTRRPQLVAISERADLASGIGSGHALVAYGLTVTAAEARILIADPNAPGDASRYIAFDRATGRYKPYQGARMADEPATEYRRIRFVPRSALTTWPAVTARWADLETDSASVGAGTFPTYKLEEQVADWRRLVPDTTVTVHDDSVTLSTVVDPDPRMPQFVVDAYRRDAASSGGWEAGRALGPKSRVRLVPGENVISVRIRQLYYSTSTAEPSPVDDGGEGVNRYVNVRRIKVRRVPLAFADFAGAKIDPADTVRFDSGVARTFTLRFDDGTKPDSIDYAQVTTTNVTGSAGVTVSRTAMGDSMQLRLTAADTGMKRVRFELRYRGKVVQNVIATVVQPSFALSVSPATVTGTRTIEGIYAVLTCTMNWRAEVLGSSERLVIGEQWRVTPDSGAAAEETITFPAEEQQLATQGVHTGTSPWWWRKGFDPATQQPTYMRFTVQWQLRYRDVATGEERLTNPVTMRCN